MPKILKHNDCHAICTELISNQASSSDSASATYKTIRKPSPYRPANRGKEGKLTSS